MMNLNDTISAFRCCTQIPPKCKECPLTEMCKWNLSKDRCKNEVKLSVNHWLKAQEPRVMTPEEVVGNIVLGRDVTLWFEFHDSINALNAKDIEYNDYLCDDDMPTLYEPNLKWRDNGYRDGVIVTEYNDVFRCWTSHPTDEQMEAAPWN